jgi:hypothetical protein
MGNAIVFTPVQPGITDSVLYTGPVGGIILSHVVATNLTGAAATLTMTVHRVISGQTEPVCTALSVGASVMEDVLNPAKLAYGGLRLDAGDTLHASASAAASVTVTATS